MMGITTTDGELGVEYRRLLRDVGDPVGLGFATGEPIRAAEDLPAHLVEVHLFRDADAAGAFVAGASLAGLGNNLGISWKAGDLVANRTVFVARYDEERPDASTAAEALRVVVHGPSGLDARSIAEGNRRAQERRDADRRAETAESRPLREALARVGCSIVAHGRGWVRFAVGDGYDAPVGTASWAAGSSRHRVRLGIEDVMDVNVDMAPVARPAVEAAGARLEDREISLEAEDAEAAAAAAMRLRDVRSQILVLRRAEFDRIFREGMRMTAARRRFIAAAAETGIHEFTNRGDRKMRAGGETIGASEIARLVRIGWIGPSGRRMTATAEGIAAAGLEPSEQTSAPRP